MTMAVVILYAGFLLNIIQPTNCAQVHWEDFVALRSYQPYPDSEFKPAVTPSHIACTTHCSIITESCFMSYIRETSMCTCHRKWSGFLPRTSSSVWYKVEDKDTPCGWYKFEPSYILFPTLPMPWHESMAYCQLLGARLIEVHTKQKDKFVRSIAKTIPGIHRVWMAGSDVTREGKWVWMNSGLPIRTYKNWWPGQPDNGDGTGREAHCLALASWYRYTWVDQVCSTHGTAVCEISGGV